jgi:hypothetical protein
MTLGSAAVFGRLMIGGGGASHHFHQRRRRDFIVGGVRALTYRTHLRWLVSDD